MFLFVTTAPQFYFFFSPLLFIPPIQPTRIREKAEIMRNWAGYREPPPPLLPRSRPRPPLLRSAPSGCGSYILFASRLISTWRPSMSGLKPSARPPSLARPQTSPSRRCLNGLTGPPVPIREGLASATALCETVPGNNVSIMTFAEFNVNGKLRRRRRASQLSFSFWKERRPGFIETFACLTFLLLCCFCLSLHSHWALSRIFLLWT